MGDHDIQQMANRELNTTELADGAHGAHDSKSESSA